MNVIEGKRTRMNRFERVCHVPDFDYSEITAEPICEDGVLYISDNAFAAYNCPCGCGKVVTLPLLPVVYYGWKYKETNGMVTLSPSIHSTGFQCKSHYFIKDNEIVWCD